MTASIALMAATMLWWHSVSAWMTASVPPQLVDPQTILELETYRADKIEQQAVQARRYLERDLSQACAANAVCAARHQ